MKPDDRRAGRGGPVVHLRHVSEPAGHAACGWSRRRGTPRVVAVALGHRGAVTQPPHPGAIIPAGAVAPIAQGYADRRHRQYTPRLRQRGRFAVLPMAFRDRIKSFERVRVGDLVPHPKNWRGNETEQAEAVRANLTKIGQVVPLTTYRRTDGKLGLIDGHLRSGLDPDAEMWVGITDLSETEAEYELAALDQLAKAKPQDDTALAALLADVQRTTGLQGTGWDDGALDKMIGQLAAEEFGRTLPEEFKEVDPTEQEFAHKCPRCGFEWDDPDE